MIKDLSTFVSDLSDMEMPAFDQSSADFLSRLKNLYATLKQVSNNYSQSYIANRMYHYNQNQQLVDDTTDAMAAPAVAVLENAVSQLKSMWNAIKNGKSGTTVAMMQGGTGHKPTIQLKQNLISVNGNGEITCDFSLVEASGTLAQNMDLDDPDGLMLLFSQVQSGGYYFGISIQWDGSDGVYVNVLKGNAVATYTGGNVYITCSPSTPFQDVLDQIQFTNQTALDGSGMGTYTYLIDSMLTPLPFNQSTPAPSSSLSELAESCSDYDWSNCDPQSVDLDLFEIISNEYPDPSPLIEDLEALL